MVKKESYWISNRNVGSAIVHNGQNQLTSCITRQLLNSIYLADSTISEDKLGSDRRLEDSTINRR